MGKLGFLFIVEDETDRKTIVVFVNEKRLDGDIVLGCDYLKVGKTQFFVLDKFYDLAEYFIMENAKLKFGKISLAKDKIVDFQDFVFWLKADDYRIVCELMFIVNIFGDRGVLESELSKRVLELYKYFEKYL